MCSLVLLNLGVDTKNIISDVYTERNVILYLNDKKCNSIIFYITKDKRLNGPNNYYIKSNSYFMQL